MSSPERKLERLDDAFLFIIGFVGLLITIIQVYFVGIAGLVESLPLIFLGIVMPFYVGYVRGTISIDNLNHSIIERMRGWVYLMIGVCAYIGYYIGYILSARAPNLLTN